MSNLIPSEIKILLPRDPPWISKPLKSMLKRKNRLFKNYKKHGYKKEDKIRLDIECQEAVETEKLNYSSNLGNKVNDPDTSQKSYWKIINRAMNKCRAPKIPPLLVNNVFVLNFGEMAKVFNDLFSKQCTPILISSVLPALNLFTDKRIDCISIQNEEIISLVRKLKPQ